MSPNTQSISVNAQNNLRSSQVTLATTQNSTRNFRMSANQCGVGGTAEVGRKETITRPLTAYESTSISAVSDVARCRFVASSWSRCSLGYLLALTRQRSRSSYMTSYLTTSEASTHPSEEKLYNSISRISLG